MGSRARASGDAAWAWLLNIQHTYLANPCIDLGKGAPEIHGSWSVLNNLDDWTGPVGDEIVLQSFFAADYSVGAGGCRYLHFA